MYSDEQFADEICKIVDPKDVYTGAQIIKMVEEKFTSTNLVQQWPTWENFREWYFDKSMAHEASDYYHFFTGEWP